MGSLYKIMKGIIFVGQLGFMLVTPPLVLVYLAYKLQTRYDLGAWIMILAIIFGILTSASSAMNLFKKEFQNKDKTKSSKKNDSNIKE